MEPDDVPSWVGDVVLRGANITPKEAKCAFILLPCEVRGMHGWEVRSMHGWEVRGMHGWEGRVACVDGRCGA